MSKQEFAFSAQQQQWYDAACAEINEERLKQLIFDLTARHSPTGAEREASEFMVDYMNKAGITAHYQPITVLICCSMPRSIRSSKAIRRRTCPRPAAKCAPTCCRNPTSTATS